MNSIAKVAATVTERLVFVDANPSIGANLVTVTGSNVTRREEKKVEEKNIVRTITYCTLPCGRTKMAGIEQPRRRDPNEHALGIISHVEVGAVVVAATVCTGCGSSVTTGKDSSAVLLGDEPVGRLAADKVGEPVDCGARGGVPDVVDVWASFLRFANSLKLSFFRAGVGLTASCTAGEKGKAIATGDSVLSVSVTPEMIAELAENGLLSSGFAGVSTSMFAVFTASSALGPGDCRGGEGGAGGFIGASEPSFEGSSTGASGISSTLGTTSFGAVTSSASAMSTSAVGAGDTSFAGVSSFDCGSGVESSMTSIAGVSSNGGEGGSGDGLFEVTSLSVGDLPSSLMEADRIRSRCSLSSCACWRSLRLNDIGGFISVRTAATPSSSVCVDAST